MMKPLCFLLLLSLTLWTGPLAADDAVKLCATDGGSFSMLDERKPDMAPRLEDIIPGLGKGGVQYKQGGCTAFYTCPNTQQIQCSGTSGCDVVSVTCSNGGSTCPEQGGTTTAIKCNGTIQQTCPCPEICFGCGSSCSTNADCASKCTCGNGFCRLGKCTCPF